MEAASAPSPPRERPAGLPRAGTFRQRRPMSTGPGGLRRGSTFVNRPQSFAADSNFSFHDAASPDPVPRLRRGSSFVSRKEQDDGKPQLRRSTRRGSDADPPFRRSARIRETATPPRPSLPRAGTFAFGMAKSSPHFESVDSVQRMPSNAKGARGKQSCGMCSSCGSGSKAMPPWAPERMSRLTAEEREEVLREMRHKEEMGRLEAELRKKRVKEMHALSARVTFKRNLQEMSDGESSQSTDDLAKVDEEYAMGELETVDLGDRERSRGRQNGRRSRSTTHSRPKEEKTEDLIRSVDVVENMALPRVVEDCGQCNGLERKVQDLEEELEVLREVVKICEENEAAERQEEAEEGRRNHGKGWMGKIASAYYGSSAAASEKTRLKEEVEALRRATDFLFQKMQAAGN